MRNWTGGRRWARLACLLGLCAALLCPGSAAAEARTVRVAFFPMDGYHITQQDGGFGGMDVEYLNAIREYTGWNIEYVPCDSWEDALDQLSAKRVDLVGSAQYSAERAEKFLYADLASGYTFGVIATGADGTIAYEDFPAMEGITFGMVSGYVRRAEFLQYMAYNGVSDPHIREYATTAQLHQALREGEIDALVHTFTEVRAGQRLIGRFAPRPFYYITWQGNDDVMRELNQAIADLKMSRPELEAELMNEFYYDRFDKMALLTTAEKEYLDGLEEITVGYLDGHYPFSYVEDGVFKGLSRDMLEAGFEATGVKLNWRQVGSIPEGNQALLDKTVDLLAFCTESEEVDSGVQLAWQYADIPLVLVMRERSAIGAFLSVSATPALQKYVTNEAGLQDFSVIPADSQEEGLTRVAEGEVDAAICDGYLAEYLFRSRPEYENLRTKIVLSAELPIYVATVADNETLQRVLTKVLTPIDSRTVMEYTLRENSYPLVSVRGFIRDHSLLIILFLLAVVALVVLAAIHFVRDERRIRRLMYKDTTLDIWNLNYLIYWGRLKLLPQKKDYAVACVTLPQYRQFNTIYGLTAGERLLRNTAATLKEQVDPENEICARDGGERFMLLLEVPEEGDLIRRLRAVKGLLEQQIYEETGSRMNVMCGLYALPPDFTDLKVAVSRAEQALEFAQSRQQPGGILVYDNLLERALKERHEREKVLESADIRKDFVAYYQPKVDIHTGEVVGAEALARFKDPAEDGAIKLPGFFVPYYEQTGRITEIDFFVCESVCQMLRRRLDAGEKVVPVSCNFSRLHFLKPGFADQLEALLERYQIPHELIEMEITETLVLEELQHNTVMETLKRLDDHHIRLSIDDFGSGYSSLGVFERIPASVVKLDRSFLLNRTDRARQVSIMRGIVKLAHELSVQVVCEGVETDEDVTLMGEIGASVAQGFFYSRPVPAEEFEEKLGTGGKT